MECFPFFTIENNVAVSLSYMVFTMLNSSGESGHSCLVPDFRGDAFSFSPLRVMFAVGLSLTALIMLCSFYACFLEGFCHKWMLNFVKEFPLHLLR